MISAHKRIKELYARASLATHSLVDDEERTALMARIDMACKRIVDDYTLAAPVRTDRPSRGH